MIQFLTQKILQWATRRNILLSIAVFIGFQIILGYFSAQIKANSAYQVPLLDFALGYDATKIYNYLLPAYNASALWNYKIAEIVDFFYPISYSIMLSLVIILGFRKIPIASFIPFIAMLFDYLENIGIAVIIYALPKQMISVVYFYQFCCYLKWIFVGISLILLAMSLFNQLRNRNNSSLS